MSEHTPTPWKIDYKGMITDSRDVPIGQTYDNPDSGNETGDDCPSFHNGQLIVTAVNSHDALVKALEDIRGLCDNPKYPYGQQVNKICDAALALARREK